MSSIVLEIKFLFEFYKTSLNSLNVLLIRSINPINIWVDAEDSFPHLSFNPTRFFYVFLEARMNDSMNEIHFLTKGF